MQGLADLAESERGVWSIAVLLITTAMLFSGRLTAEQWVDLVKYLSGILIASKAVSHAVETVKRAPTIPTATVVKEGAGEGE